MTREDSALIENLFTRLASVDRSNKDAEALQLINAKVKSDPDAAYLLVQAVLVQEQALKSYQERVERLEAEKSTAMTVMPNGRSSSFMPDQPRRGSLWRRFGGGAGGSNAPNGMPGGMGSNMAQAQSPYGGYNSGYPHNQQQPGGFGRGFGGGGGGFMASALTTAAGIAGGMLLYQGISSMFSSHGGGGGAAQASNADASAAQANNYEQVNNGAAGDATGDASQSADYGSAGGDYSGMGIEQAGGYDTGFGGDGGGFDGGGFDSMDV